MGNVESACVKCGAPLVGAAPGVQIQCPFCKAVQTPPAAPLPGMLGNPYAQAPRVNAADLQNQLARAHDGVVSATRGIVVFIVVFTLILMGAGVAVALLVARPMPTPAAQATTPPLSVAMLSTWTETRPRVLESTGMPGSIAAIDPVATVPWATSVARAWSPDAELDRIQIDDVSPEGIVDARTADGRVLYTFISPARRDAFARMQQVNERPDVLVFLRLEFDDGELTVAQTTAGTVSTTPRTAVALGCSMQQLLAAAKDHGLAPRPHYDIDLQSLDRTEGILWRWYVHRPTGSRLAESSYDPATCQPN